MRNLISLEEAVKVRCAAPAVSSRRAAHRTPWCEMQTPVQTHSYSGEVTECGLHLYFLNRNYLFTNYLSNLRSDPVNMHNQVNFKENLLVKTCSKIFRSEGIQNFVLEPLECPHTEAWSHFSIQT